MYQKILNQSPLEYFIVKPDYTVVSLHLPRLFGGDPNAAPGQYVGQFLPPEMFHQYNLLAMIDTCVQQQAELTLDNTRFHSAIIGGDVYYNLRISPVRDGDTTLAAVYLTDNNVTQDLEFQLGILQELGFYMMGTHDLDHLLFLILTGITAGQALGFNRACILLVDENEEMLKGALGVGPASAEEAGHIWSQLSSRDKPLKDFLSEYETVQDKSLLPSVQLAQKLSCPLADKQNILVRTINEKKAFHIKKTSLDVNIHQEFFHAYQNVEFLTVPIIAGDEVLGVIVADNRFNWKAIRQKHINRVKLLAQIAGITIQNAYRLTKLQETVEETRKAYESLDLANRQVSAMQQSAMVGQMAGFVAHEIRNPLATIGGFARATVRNLDDGKKVKRNAIIIVQEVKRLEELLTEILDYLRKPDPESRQDNLNEVIQETCDFLSTGDERPEVKIQTALDSRIPKFLFDRRMIRQAVLNILKNAQYFSPPGSVIDVSSVLEMNKAVIHIHDNGPGISRENMDQIFNPFFTTKDTGTGLGLAITKRIVDGHRGLIRFHSEKTKGTTVTIELPIP